ncbi:DUF4232 domain-containing protein [Streptomyces sp. NPDC005526]|uniref:DUF4232 domain-containing protein n=1 Tax=Streptomyces sp. NPDC005526 TaxID=3156885 RepID=UPI0033A7E33A
MAHTSPTHHRAVLLASAAAVLGLLTACGNDGGATGSPRKVSGTAAPATGAPTTATAPTGGTEPGGGTGTGRTATAAATGPSAARTGAGKSAGTGKATAAASTRCHTSELRASVGRNNPGAGQENFPIVLTNASGRTCTLHGYPGAAFVDAAGRQLGPDPKRSEGSPTTVTLKPGRSAWAGLSFSNPEISGARTATPAALIVTPPDERDHLTVTWTGGRVPVGGNASSVFLTVLSPGTGA